MKKLLLLLFFCLHIIHFGCSVSKKKFKIHSLETLNFKKETIINGKLMFNSEQFYLVEGYIDNKKMNSKLDSFAFEKKPKDLQKYTSFSITFYKESKETNLENIKVYPKIIDRYSNNHDVIYLYIWSNGKFLNKFKFDGEKIISPDSKIIISDAPPLDTLKN